MSKKIIIIGAGISGLATGCYAAMNDYDPVIFEAHNRPGGLCTSWHRKGFTFDFCIHNLAGSGDVKLRKIWDELGALKDLKIINREVFVRVEDSKGNALNIYTDVKKLKEHLKMISPEDQDVIENYLNAAHSLLSADFFAMDMDGISSKLKIIPKAFSIIKWGKINLEDYSHRFKNDFLRKAFSHVQYNMNGSQIPMFAHLIFMAGFEAGDMGWPKYGSLEFSKKIENRFLELGGELNYKSEVERIILENNLAIGVVLRDGSTHYGDIVVSAADGHRTIYEMLEGKYTNNFIDSYYQSFDESQEFGINVFIGVDMNLSHEPHAIALLLDEKIELEGVSRDSLYLELFDSATGLVPEGHSIIKVVTQGNYDYWKNLDSDKEKYNEEKKIVYEKILNTLKQRFPTIEDKIKIFDVTTPVTVERYTHNFHGGQPWPAKEGEMKIMFRGLSKTLPGLDNFYMVGQWAGAMVGLPNAALTGRNLIKDLCKKDGKKFQTTEK